MRARNLKPGFFKNEYLAELGPYAQLIFQGLWCLADREGKLENRPKRIKAEIFPYYEPQPNVQTLLNKLEEAGFIIRYSANGLRLIKILNFSKHQNPHHTEKASIYSEPPVHENNREIHQTTSVNSRKSNGENLAETLKPDTLGTTLAGGSRRTASADPSPSPGVCVDSGPTDEDKPTEDTHIKAAGVGEADQTDSESETEVLDGGNGNDNGAKTRFTPNDLGRLWNETADPVFPRVIIPLSEKRARKFRPAIRARPDPEWWKALFVKAGGISFLRGENDRGWRADLEFVVRRWEEVLEGKYDRARPQEGPSQHADPGCQICQGDGWEYVEENGDRWAKPCRCTTKVRQHGYQRPPKSGKDSHSRHAGASEEGSADA
jgi:hypothetical protein